MGCGLCSQGRAAPLGSRFVFSTFAVSGRKQGLGCAWESIAYCPLSAALGAGSRSTQSFHSKWRTNRNLGRNLMLPVHRMCPALGIRNFAGDWCARELPPPVCCDPNVCLLPCGIRFVPPSV